MEDVWINGIIGSTHTFEDPSELRVARRLAGPFGTKCVTSSVRVRAVRKRRSGHEQRICAAKATMCSGKGTLRVRRCSLLTLRPDGSVNAPAGQCLRGGSRRSPDHKHPDEFPLFPSGNCGNRNDRLMTLFCQVIGAVVCRIRVTVSAHFRAEIGHKVISGRKWMSD